MLLSKSIKIMVLGALCAMSVTQAMQQGAIPNQPLPRWNRGAFAHGNQSVKRNVMDAVVAGLVTTMALSNGPLKLTGHDYKILVPSACLLMGAFPLLVKYATEKNNIRTEKGEQILTKTEVAAVSAAKAVAAVTAGACLGTLLDLVRALPKATSWNFEAPIKYSPIMALIGVGVGTALGVKQIYNHMKALEQRKEQLELLRREQEILWEEDKKQEFYTHLNLEKLELAQNKCGENGRSCNTCSRGKSCGRYIKYADQYNYTNADDNLKAVVAAVAQGQKEYNEKREIVLRSEAKLKGESVYTVEGHPSYEYGKGLSRYDASI